MLAVLAFAGCGGGAKAFAIGEQQVGPYRVVVTSPNPPKAGQPVTFEVTVFDSGDDRVQNLGLKLLISRKGTSGPPASIQETAMHICKGCGAYRVDTTLAESGTYTLSFTLPMPPGQKAETLEFPVTLQQ